MKNKKGTVLIYTLVLVFLSTIMATVIFNIAASLASNSDLQNISSRLSRGVLGKGDLAIKYTKTLNSNGSGFIDNIGCPNSVTMSGSSLRTTGISTSLTFTGTTVYCQGTYNSSDFKVYFNTGFTDLVFAEYEDDNVEVSSGIGSRDFFDSDSTRINFTASLPLSPDGIDDNFNSDDYLVTSTGTLQYPDGFIDDDAKARKNIYGYVNPDAGYTNIFWSNMQTSAYINNNPNNSDSLHETIGAANSAYMKLDANKSFRMRIYQFDRLEYAETRQLFSTGTLNSEELAGGIGYIQNNSGTLSLSAEKTGNEYEFDFVQNDYAIFLLTTSTGALLYNISAETPTGTGIYINPVDDSGADVIKVLANDMVIAGAGGFLTEQFEVIDFK